MNIQKLPYEKLDVKIIALDLDDTLLNHELIITSRTVTALQKAAAKGIYIVLCSGRAENAILPYVRQLNIAGSQAGRYLIAINGAEVFDLHMRLPVMTKKLPAEILRFVYEEAKKRGLPAQVYDASTIYASVDNKWTQVDARLCGLRLKIVDEFYDFMEAGHPKMVIPAEPEDINDFIPFLQEKLKGKAEIFISKPYFLEIMPPECGKGEAVLWLADRLGIPQSQTMAFGDSMNDETMIRKTAYGVAMSNGLPYIQEIAKFVTRKSNEEDGIGDFIEEYVL
jgi:Cof subfamily protein (haloacid dehalogenase superfamily)